MASGSRHPYLDSSALVKLIVEESETRALRAWLGTGPDVVSSELALAEVPRAVIRGARDLDANRRRAARSNADAILAALDLVSLDRETLEATGRLPGAWLRTLDAIHVVAALSVSDAIDAFVTYDERQAEAAGAHGLRVVAPR